MMLRHISPMCCGEAEVPAHQRRDVKCGRRHLIGSRRLLRRSRRFAPTRMDSRVPRTGYGASDSDGNRSHTTVVLLVEPDRRQVLVDIMARAHLPAFDIAAIQHDAVAPPYTS